MSEISKECTGGAGVSGGVEYKFKIYMPYASWFYITFVEADASDKRVCGFIAGDGWAQSVGQSHSVSVASNYLTYFTIDEYNGYMIPLYFRNSSIKPSVVWFDGNQWNEIQPFATGHTTEETALEVTVVYIPPKE